MAAIGFDPENICSLCDLLVLTRSGPPAGPGAGYSAMGKGAIPQAWFLTSHDPKAGNTFEQIFRHSVSPVDQARGLTRPVSEAARQRIAGPRCCPSCAQSAAPVHWRRASG